MTQVDRVEVRPSTLMLRRRGIVRALETMRLQLADPMSLEYLAKTAAMSRFHFERVFQQITGLTPFQFLAAIRLVRARELVLNTDTSITAICFDVGYSSVGTFTRRFTASVGLSPRRLRRFSEAQRAAAAGALAAGAGRAADPGADVVVHCSGIPEDAQLFIGAFPSPVPIGRPVACALVSGSRTLVLRDLPAGSHYLLGAAHPASATPDQLGGLDSSLGIVGPALVQIEDRLQQEVTVQLRPIEVTDPPIVSFLPLLFHECSAQHPDGSTSTH